MGCRFLVYGDHLGSHLEFSKRLMMRGWHNAISGLALLSELETTICDTIFQVVLMATGLIWNLG